RADSRVRWRRGCRRGGAALVRARPRRVAGAGPGRRALRLAARAQSTGRRFVNPRVWGRRLAGRRAADKLRRGSDVPTRDLDERRQNVNPFYHRIYRVVRHIPRARVPPYGPVARLAGRPGAPRPAGWAAPAFPL